MLIFSFRNLFFLIDLHVVSFDADKVENAIIKIARVHEKIFILLRAIREMYSEQLFHIFKWFQNCNKLKWISVRLTWMR